MAMGAGCQLVLSGCWWLCAGGYGCSLPAVAIDALRLWAGGYGCSRGTDAGQLVLSGC